MFVLALIPLALFTTLLVFTKSRLLWTSLLTFFVTCGLVFFAWHMNAAAIQTSVWKGITIAFDILLIIVGAVFFLETLNSAHIIRRLCIYLETFSKDYRIQALLLAWFLESFFEGTAGFGAPLTIVAPLLVGIGLAPMQALVVTLLGNSASGIFGAAGTPIRTGLAGLPILNVPLYAATLNLVGFLVPVFMLWTVTRSQKKENVQFFEALPFALVSGLAFVVPSVLLVPLGQEFPTILGSVIGLLIMLLFIKFGFLVPKTTRTLKEEHLPHDTMPLYKVFIPYGLLISLMVGGKFMVGSFNPGFAFVVAALPVLLLWKEKTLSIKTVVLTSLKRSWEPFVVIAAVSAMVQLMINSGQNSAQLPSILDTMTRNLPYDILHFLSPAIGAFGSFVTGSTTVSNIMFGGLLKQAAENAGYGVTLILSLQLVGAAAGNMISIADVLPAQAVVGLNGREREVIRKVLLPCITYVTLIILAGMLLEMVL
ncbi:MAG: L-lactate permease [Patescibacteria group bacterium]|jgi:lactate permease